MSRANHAVTVNESAFTQLSAQVQQLREMFVEIVRQSLYGQSTSGTCLYAASVGARILNKFSPARVTVRGGDGAGDGGICVSGVWHGHYWMEAMIDGERYVVDITGDQFGLPPVQIREIESSRGDYVPGCQATVDVHVEELLRGLAGGAAANS